jgi:SAM-dependent methyltransferase
MPLGGSRRAGRRGSQGSGLERGARTAALLPVLLALVLALGQHPACRGRQERGTASEAPVRFPNTITVRNLTRDTVTYTVTRFASLDAPVLKCLSPGAMDRYKERQGLVLAYWRPEGEQTAILSPGRPYCFRPDEDEHLRLYPGSHMKEGVEDLAPYVSTPAAVVDKMLALAEVGPDDVVYDLGCGDGRIVIQAARRYGAQGVGVDIDPERIAEARRAAREAGVERLVSFRVGDAMTTDVSQATVLSLYLLPESNALLEPRLERLLGRGARVITHNYSMPGWESRRIEAIDLKDDSGAEHTIFLYKM